MWEGNYRPTVEKSYIQFRSCRSYSCRCEFERSKNRKKQCVQHTTIGNSDKCMRIMTMIKLNLIL